MSTFTLMGVPGLIRKVLNYLEANGTQINNLADLDAPVSGCAKVADYTSARAGYLDNLQAYTASRGLKLDNLDNLDVAVSSILANMAINFNNPKRLPIRVCKWDDQFIFLKQYNSTSSSIGLGDGAFWSHIDNHGNKFSSSGNDATWETITDITGTGGWLVHVISTVIEYSTGPQTGRIRITIDGVPYTMDVTISSGNYLPFRLIWGGASYVSGTGVIGLTDIDDVRSGGFSVGVGGSTHAIYEVTQTGDSLSRAIQLADPISLLSSGRFNHMTRFNESLKVEVYSSSVVGGSQAGAVYHLDIPDA